MKVYPILAEPGYGWSRDGVTPYRPTAREVGREWLNAIDLRRGPSRIVPFLTAVFYAATAILAVVYVARGPSLASLAFVASCVFVISTLYNTVWFHRYCSHKAFRFRSRLVRSIFLWTNPIFLREETYALPHHVHHAASDRPRDPYGPHLGWLGSFVAFETAQKTNTDIPRFRYEALKKLLAHVGVPMNSYEAFRRTAAVEPIGHFVLRATTAQALYAGAAWLAGGGQLVLAWFAAVFVFNTMLRDFNWRGHGGARARAQAPRRPGQGLARDQWFYGFLAGEWHESHHRHPRSARAGLGPGQLDLAFAVIRLMHRAGAVASYHEEREPMVANERTFVSTSRERERAVVREILLFAVTGILGVAGEVFFYNLVRAGRLVPGLADILFSFDWRVDGRLSLGSIWDVPIHAFFGQCSLWMIPVYAGATLYVVRPLSRLLRGQHVILRAAAFAVGITLFEGVAGVVYRPLLGFSVWTYVDSGAFWGGATSLRILPLWGIVGLFTERVITELSHPAWSRAFRERIAGISLST